MVKTAIIGLGYRGNYLKNLLGRIPAFDLVAGSDPRTEGSEAFPVYTDYRQMVEECHPDLVIIASPWQFHIEQGEFCISYGCHVALEIRGGHEKGEYDNLIRLQKETGLKVFPLENVIFDRRVRAIAEMVSQGLFGEIVYMRGGYRHDLRKVLTGDGNEAKWRAPLYKTENADIYPTHGFAPLCNIAGIKQIQSLHSFASKARGMELVSKGFAQTMGDVISTQILTPDGILVNLTHDTTLPRPKSLDLEVQGTLGIWNADLASIFFEGMKGWEPDETYVAKYPGYYWQKYGDLALKEDPHHSGMDYIMLKAVEDDLKGLVPYPAGVEDLALWTSVTYLSDASIKSGS